MIAIEFIYLFTDSLISCHEMKYIENHLNVFKVIKHKILSFINFSFEDFPLVSALSLQLMCSLIETMH